MMKKSKKSIPGYLFGMALAALISISMPESGKSQEPGAPSSTRWPASAAAVGSTASPAEEKEAGTAIPPTPQSNTQSSTIKRFDRNGPTRESWMTVGLGAKYIRAVLGGFEQGAKFSFGVQLTSADALKFVELRATAFVSTLLYRRFEAEAYFPRVFGENTHADIWFDYLRRPEDNFFGIGPRIPNTSQTNFDLEQRSYNGSLYHDFNEQLQVGGYLSVSNSATYKGQEDDDIPINLLFSGDRDTVPPAQWVPGLLTTAKILSYGGFAQYDLRNDSEGLTKGAYFYTRVGSSKGLKNKTAFSDYGWLTAELEARGYIPLGGAKTSLALRGYATLKDPRGGSQIPFYELPFLGGQLYGRGFKSFRFRGNNMLLASAELRQTVRAQSEERGLDVFGFGDAGQVWGDNRSQTDPAILVNKDFNSSNWRASIGGGLQYRFSKNFAARIELGHSHERNLIYFSFTRGF